jgi:hypothetical protein
MTPPKPVRFTPQGAPVGVEVKSVTFAASRPVMAPRSVHIHTNGASREGSIESSWNWSHAKPNSNTLPHYQVDRTHGGVTRCRKMLATDLRGIGSGTVMPTNGDWSSLTAEQQATIAAHGDCRKWTIVIETADTGYLADPGISAFDAGQAELIATILAYESIVHGFPLEVQPNYWSPGVASHTDPFGYPYTTLAKGKICPGAKKKAQVRDFIIPRAGAIRRNWLRPPAPPPPPPPPTGDDDVNWNLPDAALAPIHSAPPTADVLAGEVNDWAVAALIKAFQADHDMTVTGRWTQQVGEAINEALN